MSAFASERKFVERADRLCARERERPEAPSSLGMCVRRWIGWAMGRMGGQLPAPPSPHCIVKFPPFVMGPPLPPRPCANSEIIWRSSEICEKPSVGPTLPLGQFRKPCSHKNSASEGLLKSTILGGPSGTNLGTGRSSSVFRRNWLS